MARRNGVFPAHAGMNRDISANATSRTRIPRARGDEPSATQVDLVPA